MLTLILIRITLTPELLDRAYSAHTKALIVQHTYGIAQDMEPILKWAASKGVPIK